MEKQKKIGLAKREQNGGDQNGETEENRACSRRRRYEMRI